MDAAFRKPNADRNCNRFRSFGRYCRGNRPRTQQMSERKPKYCLLVVPIAYAGKRWAAETTALPPQPPRRSALAGRVSGQRHPQLLQSLRHVGWRRSRQQEMKPPQDDKENNDRCADCVVSIPRAANSARASGRRPRRLAAVRRCSLLRHVMPLTRCASFRPAGGAACLRGILWFV
jgi:hypothetical protein